MNYVIFSLACITGYLIFKKIRIPTPMILGPMCLVALINLTGNEFQSIELIKPLLSYMTGLFAGLRFHLNPKGLIKHIVLVLLWMLILSTLTAKLLSFTGLTGATALFAAFPGGLAEISLMSIDYGSDTFAVALLQSSRLIATMILMPILLSKIEKEDGGEIRDIKYESFSWKRFSFVAFISGVCALVMDAINIPAGVLVGSVIGSSLATQVGHVHIRINRKIQLVVQMLIGGTVGLTISLESIINISHYIIPILLLNVMILGGSGILAILYHKLGNWNLQTCVLAASPAGLSPTIMLALECNADPVIVTLFQVMRMVSVLIIVPFAAWVLL